MCSIIPLTFKYTIICQQLLYTIGGWQCIIILTVGSLRYYLGFSMGVIIVSGSDGFIPMRGNRWLWLKVCPCALSVETIIFVPVVNNWFAVHQSLQVSWGSMGHSDFSLSIGSGVICSVVAQNSSYDVCLPVELCLCDPILVAVQQATSVASSTHIRIDVTSMSSLSSTSLGRCGALSVEYKQTGSSIT